MDEQRNIDRREEQRSPLSGEVRFSFSDPNPMEVAAQLIESSERGFRASHESKSLVPGLELHYQRLSCSGRARVIWTHLLAGQCVSGFLILQGDKISDQI